MDWRHLADQELWNAVVEVNRLLTQIDAQQEFLSTGFSGPAELNERAEQAANNLRSLEHLRLQRESLVAEMKRRNLSDIDFSGAGTNAITKSE